MIRFGRLALTLALILFSVTAFASRPIGSPAIGAPVSSGGSPRVAKNGSTAFAIWTEHRDRDRIIGSRIDRDGKPLDGFGIVVAEATSSLTYLPAITAWGDGFAVAWIDGGYGWLDPGTARVSIISATGEVTSLPLPDLRGTYVAIASQGDRLLLVLSDGSDRYRLRFVMIGADGRLLSNTPTAYFAPVFVSAAGRTDGFAVVFDSSNGINAVTLSRDGLAIASAWIESPPPRNRIHARQPSVAADDEGYLVAWNELRFSPRWGTVLRTRRLHPGGSVDAPAITLPEVEPYAAHPSIVSNGAGFDLAFVGYADSDNAYGWPTAPTRIYLQKLDSSGSPASTALRIEDVPHPTAPDVTRKDDASIVVWSRSRQTDTWTMSAESAAVGRSIINGVVGEPQILSLGYRSQNEHAVAASGELMLAAWSEAVGPDLRRQVFYARVAANGTALDDRIAAPESPVDQRNPAIAANPNAFVLTWTEGDLGAPSRTVRLAAIDRDGRVTRELRLGPIEAESRAVAAWNGSIFLVIWPEPNGTLVGLQLDAWGHPIQRTPYVVLAAHQSLGRKNVEIVPARSLFVAAWQSEQYYECHITCNPYDWEIQAARFSAEGFLMDPAPRLIAPVFSSPPRLASRGSEVLIAYQACCDLEGVRGTLLRSDGSLVIKDAKLAGWAREYDVAWGADRWIVATQGDELVIRRNERAVDLSLLREGIVARQSLRPRVATIGGTPVVFFQRWDVIEPDRGAWRLRVALPADRRRAVGK